MYRVLHHFFFGFALLLLDAFGLAADLPDLHPHRLHAIFHPFKSVSPSGGQIVYILSARSRATL